MTSGFSQGLLEHKRDLELVLASPPISFYAGITGKFQHVSWTNRMALVVPHGTGDARVISSKIVLDFI